MSVIYLHILKSFLEHSTSFSVPRISVSGGAEAWNLMWGRTNVYFLLLFFFICLLLTSGPVVSYLAPFSTFSDGHTEARRAVAHLWFQMTFAQSLGNICCSLVFHVCLFINLNVLSKPLHLFKCDTLLWCQLCCTGLMMFCTICQLLEVPDGHRAPVPPQSSSSSGSQSDPVTTLLSSSSTSSSPCSPPAYIATSPSIAEDTLLDLRQG